MRGLRERIRRRRGAERLLALAGRAAGAERRGSVLILIVGALAMLSVVTLVYFTIGRADRRTAQVAEEKSRVDEVIGTFRSYLSDDVIGADALAMYVDGYDRTALGAPPTGAPANPDGAIRYREAFDYPSTDRALLSVPPLNSTWMKFNAVGTFGSAWPSGGVGDNDARVPSDPWLADAEPTILGGASATGSLPDYVRADWGHISNVSPSGNFVNLYNLRDNFDAPSGFQNAGTGALPIVGGMSDRLWLYDRGGLTTLSAQRPDSSKVLDFASTNARPAVPAHWDSRQKGAALPARDARYTPGNERYIPYQWADADGDGILDSRWFEMVDVGDPTAPVSLLPRDDRFRYFFAVRIVDLAGRVNVNTATAFNTNLRPDSRPSADYPAGLTPADVDLLNLLGMTDLYSRFGGSRPGYDFLERVMPAGVPSDYRAYDDTATADAGLLAHLALRKSLRELVVPPAGAIPSLGSPSTVLDSAQGRYTWFAQAAGQGDGAAYYSTGTPASVELRRGGLFDNADLLELLTYNGTNDADTLSRLEQAAGGGRAAAGVSTQANLGVMRDNRTAQAEREGLDNAENAGRGNGVPDDDAFVKMMVDVRQRLTTLSAARPVAPARIPQGDEASLSARNDEKVDAVEAVLRATHPTAYGARDAGLLLSGYADALMPHSWRTNYWKHANGSPDATTRTLAYGHDPILAAWTTGHLVANMIDMFDRDGTSVATDLHTPTAFTLALAGDQAGLSAIDTASTGLQAQYPFWGPRPGGSGGGRTKLDGTLDLDRALGIRTQNTPQAGETQPSRMAALSDLPTGMPPAVNIFGVEAQPFISEVGMLTIYTDARYAPSGGPSGGSEGFGGDEEWQAGSAGPPPVPPTPGPVTIDGHLTENNKDFLCQVLVVQITNPFDCDIDLTGSDTAGYSTYYLQFAKSVFKLAKVDSAGANPTGVTLKGRDPSGATHENTLTFYVMNDTLADIANRWENARFTGPGGSAVSTADVETFIKNQLRFAAPSGGGRPIEPILISRMEPATGALETGFVPLITGDTAEDTTVKLWRVIKSPLVEASESAQNNFLNDLLVDRITDPVDLSGGRTKPTLDRSLAPSNNTVGGTQCGPDPEDLAGGGANPMDNTGYSIAMWASFKRMDDPRDPSGVGHVPRGALPAYCVEAPRGWAFTLSGTPFKNIASSQQPRLDLGSVSGWGSGDADQEYFAATSLNGASNAAGPSLYTAMGTTPPNADPVTKKCADGFKATIREWPEEKNITAERVPANAAGRAYDAMYAEVALNDRNFENAQTPPVTTLRVADLLLPLAVGPMCVPDPALAGSTWVHAQDSSWLTLGEAMAVSLGYASPPNGAGFERWRPLRALASSTRPATDRGNLVLDDFVPFENNDADAGALFNIAGGDRRRSPGVPLALSILDRFRTLEPQFGSIAHATPGVVNLNTASLPVLGSLPMMSPARTAQGGSAWWGTASAAPESLNVLNDSDLAAGLVAYRDKTPVMDRQVTPVTFENTPAAQQALDNAFAWNGRNTTNTVSAVREAPGLASLGEVACLIDASGTRLPARDQATFLGDDLTGARTRNGAPGVTSILYRPRPLNTLNPDAQTEPNEIADDFGEKVALLAALGNTASVRSDVFAVWFIVNGYQRSDTENLQPGDPLWPTISRRYVMVVDRSSVTRLGDKPRVLFCREVPR